MPRYTMLCNSCQHSYDEILFSFSEPLPEVCPECGEKSLVRDYEHDGACAQIFVEPTTVGQLGERNFKALPREKQQKMLEESAMTKPQKTPWFRDGSIHGTKKLDKPLDVRTIKDPQRYVLTGEKD